MSTAEAPRPGLRDHLHVLGLLFVVGFACLRLIVLGAFDLLCLPFVRQRMRRRLESDPPLAEVADGVDAAAWQGKTIFVLAGETSGDRLAAPVVRAIRRLAPGARLRGYAGPACAEEGVALDDDLTAHAVVGVIPVLKTLPTWWGVCARFHALLRAEPPDLLLTVDFPGLNVRLARMAHRRGVRTVHLVAPAVWAYGRLRAGRWRRAVHRLLALFPHEPPLLAETGLSALYVGHPLFEAPLPPPRTPESLPAHGDLVVELLPGSRRGELQRHVPAMAEVAARLEAEQPRLSFVLRVAEERQRALVEELLARAKARPRRLRVDVGLQPLPGPLVAAFASSGTVTAELGAALVPQVVCYGVSPFARVGASLLLTAPWFALVNLVAGHEVARERLFVRHRTALRMADDLRALWATPAAWSAARDALRPVRARLERAEVAARAARAVLT